MPCSDNLTKLQPEREGLVTAKNLTILGVLDGHDDTGSQHELLPGFGEVDHVEAVGAALPDVGSLRTWYTVMFRLAVRSDSLLPSVPNKRHVCLRG